MFSSEPAIRDDGAHVVVTLRGELDIANAADLHYTTNTDCAILVMKHYTTNPYSAFLVMKHYTTRQPLHIWQWYTTQQTLTTQFW